jgi:nitrogen fixation protein FixH
MKPNFNPWPYGIILFFVLLICAIAGVVVIAATHSESLVSENYYEQELKYQDQIDSAVRAQKCGATVRLDANGGKLLLAVPAAEAGQKFSGKIEFYRPSSPALDRTVPFAPAADGSQAVDVSKLAAGLWEVRVKWNSGGQSYFLEQKIAL